MPYIPVPVPEELVPEVYALLARLQSGGKEPESEPVPAELTGDLVERIHGESGPAHRAFMEHLAANAGRWVGSRELIDVLRLSHGSKSLAGLLGSFGRRA